MLGPSRDGGYYLLGLKAPHRRLFEDVAWSTEHVAAQTRVRAAEIGLPVHILPEWYDVDDASTLAVLERELLNGEQPQFATVTGFDARWTREFLAKRVGAVGELS